MSEHPTGTVEVRLQGPADHREAAVAALTEAGIAAEPSEDLGDDFVEAHFHNGADRPDADFIAASERSAAKVVSPFGFQLVESTTYTNNLLATKWVYDKDGRFLDTFNPADVFTPSAERLLAISERHGVPLEELDIRDHPDLEMP
ncbi:hypothetical protein [Streptomyces sp. NPDC127098]|uniref:hypothetical protein n=1 Tax=Streptomyces sp. NPDC127098 TaxID=3347137 RepID=UPI0036491D6A